MEHDTRVTIGILHKYALAFLGLLDWSPSRVSTTAFIPSVRCVREADSSLFAFVFFDAIRRVAFTKSIERVIVGE